MTIISHQHRFIHIKTVKVAGTSAEIALSRHCGPADVLTPVSDEALRARLGGRCAQHYRMVKPGSCQYSLYIHKHMSAAAVITQIGEATRQRYFTFCFERNPWDKAVSYYFWRKYQNADKSSFQAFIRSPQIKRICNWEMYANDDGPIVDFVGQYHQLQRDWQRLEQHLSLPNLWPLPSTHDKTGRPSRDYREFYQNGDQAHIARLFSREIDYFGYTF